MRTQSLQYKMYINQICMTFLFLSFTNIRIAQSQIHSFFYIHVIFRKLCVCVSDPYFSANRHLKMNIHQIRWYQCEWLCINVKQPLANDIRLYNNEKKTYKSLKTVLAHWSIYLCNFTMRNYLSQYLYHSIHECAEYFIGVPKRSFSFLCLFMIKSLKTVSIRK